MALFQNAIRLNHRGFTNSAKKRFVLVDNKTGDISFTVFAIRNVENILVFKGELKKIEYKGKAYFTGDFSEVAEDGDYFIKAGGYTSRQFVIYGKAYDNALRMMLQYFTWQRCGHDLGWNGKCHADDGYIKETGEHVDLSGGYHQSCDLRKSPGGVSIGVLSMLRFALKDNSAWGKHLTIDEAAWACDYFVKTIQDSGAMYNTLSSPFGWEGRVFYKSPAPSSAQWNTTSILATGYILFKDSDPERAEKYLAAAKRSWNFMNSDERPKGVYKHPEPFPRGMDPDFFYEQCYKGSSADLGYRIQVACDMYRATGDDGYISNVRDDVKSFVNAIPNGRLAQMIMRNDGSGRTVLASGTYAWLPGGFIALCDAYEILGDIDGLGEKLREIADALCNQANLNVWGKITPIFTDSDLDTPYGHPAPGQKSKTLRETDNDFILYDTLPSGEACYIRNSEKIASSVVSSFGIFLARAAKILGEKKYLDTAQSLLDIIMGANALDSSHIYGIGYNQAQRHAYGQFFPSTPFIPGAIGTPYDTIDVYESHSEYDMPYVGMTLYLISEITN